MRGFRNIGALAALSLAAVGPIAVADHGEPPRRQSFRRKRSGSIADKPHKHLREIARRTTRPGTPERKAAYEAARRG